MKAYKFLVFVFAAVFLLQPVADTTAQQRQENPIRRIMGIRQERVLTPQYDLRVGRTERSTKRWMQISVAFETAPEWIDELEMRMYVFFDTNMAQQPSMLFYESVTFMDVPQGRHTEMMYIHPHTFERFVNNIRFIGVEFRVQGRPMAWYTDEREMREQQWWTAAMQQFPPVSGRLFHLSETPFALINVDEHQLVKEIGTR